MDNLSGTIMNPKTSGDISTLDSGGASSAPHRIIMVDDEPGNRMLCRQALEPDGMVCDEAADGIQGLKSTTWGNYDLLLLDIDMLGMQGEEVLRQIRKNPPSPHLKIIMMSGRATGDEMARMMRAGADDYLSKPFSLVQLLERVKAAMRLKMAQERSDMLNRNLLRSSFADFGAENQRSRG